MLSAHLVAHTHWDREWYHPFVRFRQRLVALIDELLDDPPPPNESFLLDGQAILLEDYLAVRPEREEELAGLLWSGRLEAGPWYVLADELIPSGEALVRNLLLGRRVLRRLHAAAPPVLYCPDSFGHPAALPTIAAGFGLRLIIVWRGFGGRRWPASDTLLWSAPDAATVVVYHLPPDGYEFGSSLPLDGRAARQRWQQMRAVLEGRAGTDVVLVPNGADHHARQQGQSEAVRLLAEAAAGTGDTVHASGLVAFSEELLARARSRQLPRIAGELRDSYGYTWTLQGTLASRAAQKRHNARAERLLVRDAEPWSALARQRAGVSRLPLLVAAWRTLLQAHPHDTLCGCSIDAVADAMDRRLDDAVAQGIGIRDDGINDLIGYDAGAARARKSEWKPVVLVRNRAPRTRGGVALVDIEQFIADVPVGPGSVPKDRLGPAGLPLAIAERPAGEFLTSGLDRTDWFADGSRPVQVLDQRTDWSRIESPHHYPDNDRVVRSRVAVWIDAVPGYGIVSLPLGESGMRPAAVPRPVRVTDASLENGIVRISTIGGRISLEMLETGRRIGDLLEIEDWVDCGDLYTPSFRGPATIPEFLGPEVTEGGPLIGELRLKWRLRDLAGDKRSGETTLAIHVALVAESALVRLRVTGRNRRRDHRLRLGIRTDARRGAVWADAAFGPVHRVRLQVPNEDAKVEAPLPTAPLHRYVSVVAAKRGATVFSDGLAEYEATKNGTIFATLLRAVGELSKNDLEERPGHAGWPASTPKAQSLARFAARFAIMLHGPRTNETIDAIERTADDALLPLEGHSLRSALSVPPPILGVELQGTGLAFSTLKESEDGDWIVARCTNLLEISVAGAWVFGTPIREARYARLDETPLEPLTVWEDTVRFDAPPRGVVTVLVR